jgi:pyocin large subunit-like protein
MRRLPGWLLPIAVFVAVFAAVFRLTGPPAPTPRMDATEASSPTQAVWSHGADGASANAQEHWQKHGGDFPELHGAEEYDRAALDFVHHPPPGTQVKHRGNGDTLFFDPSTGDFAVEDEDGEPRTFFRPRRGADYWARQ